jgi:hypothetical protein
MLEANTSKLSI